MNSLSILLSLQRTNLWLLKFFLNHSPLCFCRFLFVKLTSWYQRTQNNVSTFFLTLCNNFASGIYSAVDWCNYWYDCIYVYIYIHKYTHTHNITCLLWFLCSILPSQYSLDYLNIFRLGYDFHLSFDFLASTLCIILIYFLNRYVCL